MYFVDRTAVVLKPTEVFLEWLKGTGDIPDLTLAQLRANCSVFLVPQFEEPEEAVAYFDERYRGIFEAELASWAVESEQWPQERSLKTFWEFFELDIHDTVLDLADTDLQVSPVSVTD